jgi:glycogen(starch) synthase
MSVRPRIALVSREVAPFGGGGIGTYVTATARALAPVADVTVFTTSLHERGYEELVGGGDPRVADLNVRFVPEPKPWNVSELDTHLHVWSGWVFEALIREYPGGGPDLVEFPDFLGEGFVTAQARRALDRRLRDTTVCVRLYTTSEMTSVLDGYVSDEFADRVTFELERYALANCDHVLWPGGDVLGTYRRRYGDDQIAEPALVRHTLGPDPGAPITTSGAERSTDGPLRLLFIGRLERRKGVLDLARAVAGLPRDDFRLTLLGGDTETAPLGQSMRAMLELMFGRDDRVELRDHVPREQLPSAIEDHDVVLLPSLWECWPAVGLEALERNRPLLTTPTGGFTEMVQQDRSGWQTRRVGAEPLARAIEDLLDHRERCAAIEARGLARDVHEALTDLEEIQARYVELAGAKRQRAASSASSPESRPLVSVIIPYYRLEGFIGSAVRSVLEQTYPSIELIIVNDGSLREADRIVFDLEERFPLRVLTTVNSGLGSARNTGVVHSLGEYVFFLDADNVASPRLVERCVEVLEAAPHYVYATSWSRYIDDRGEQWGAPGSGYRPLGNWSPLVHEKNTAGDAAALFRRSVFVERGIWFSQELTSFEDWAFYRRLHERGLFGQVIPEALLDYRVRSGSMMREFGSPNLERLHGEMRAYLMEDEAEWTSSNA